MAKIFSTQDSKRNIETKRAVITQNNIESKQLKKSSQHADWKMKQRSFLEGFKGLLHIPVGAMISLITMIIFATGNTGSPSLLIAPTPSATIDPLLVETTVSQKVLGKVQSATVRVVGKGTFANPFSREEKPITITGSGFIYHPDGFVLTNQHVIAGTTAIEVYLQGGTQPHKANVIGFSECANLAVLDVDGQGFPYLDFYEDEPQVGFNVFAAGFLYGNSVFTLNRGSISRIDTNDGTAFASINRLIRHRAFNNSMNSGGPLITTDGRVLAVNFGGDQGTAADFAIDAADAQEIINKLQAGEPVASIGINGSPYQTPNGSLTGIWVFSVLPGSAAEAVGIQPGDMIIELGGVPVGTDGSMTDYCGVLQSYDETELLNVLVFRPQEGNILSGQINGAHLKFIRDFSIPQIPVSGVPAAITETPTPTETVGVTPTATIVETPTSTDTGSSASTDAIAETPTPNETGLTAEATTTPEAIEWVKITDDSGSIEVKVPAEWVEVDGSTYQTSWGVIKVNAPAVTASTDLDRFISSYDVPGLFFTASSDLGQAGGYLQLLYRTNDWFRKECVLMDTKRFKHELYEGKYNIWQNCGPNKTYTVLLSARPKVNPTSFLIMMELRLMNEQDLAYFRKILKSIVIKGDV